MIKSERTVTLLIIFKRCSLREVEIKTEPIQEERNREQREGPPKPPTAIHISSTVQGEREKAKTSTSTESRRLRSVQPLDP